MTSKILRNFTAWLAMALLAVVGQSCNDNDGPVPQPQPVNPQPEAGGTRSVLVYMLADNSLGDDGFDRSNLSDMIAAFRAGDVPEGHLIVYHDDAKASSPMLKEVTAKGLKILKSYGAEPGTSVTATRMHQVIDDFRSVAPADRYGLILWSHATGWLVVNPLPQPSIAPQWVGEDRRHYMDVATLASVLEGQGFDYIYFDCCHMASVEALYELRHCADRFVGSCAELPAAGMPYKLTMPLLMKYDADLVGAATAVYDHYNAKQGVDRSATMSVIEAAALEPLAEATRAVYSLHPELPAGYSGQRYERFPGSTEEYLLYDFEDYMSALYSTTTSREMRRAYADWLLALDDCVSYRAATPFMFSSLKINTHSGLSTFALRSAADAATGGYATTEWYADVASALFDDGQP